MLSHQNDPHLSREDNAAQLAQRVQSASGVNAGEQYIGQAIQALEAHHLPAGVRGFVVIEPPAPGTLAAGIGLQPYDLIFEAEGLPLVDAATGLPSVTEFARIKTASWEERGMCELRVYSFTTRSYRRVHFGMPPGKPTAILGASIRPIPYVLEHVQSLAQAGSSGSSAGQEELFVKGWRKSGMMYISCTPNHYPLHGVLTPENADIYVKVRRTRRVLLGASIYRTHRVARGYSGVAQVGIRHDVHGRVCAALQLLGTLGTAVRRDLASCWLDDGAGWKQVRHAADDARPWRRDSVCLVLVLFISRPASFIHTRCCQPPILCGTPFSLMYKMHHASEIAINLDYHECLRRRLRDRPLRREPGLPS